MDKEIQFKKGSELEMDEQSTTEKLLNYINMNLRNNDRQEPYLVSVNKNLYAIRRLLEKELELKGWQLIKKDDGSWEYEKIKK